MRVFVVVGPRDFNERFDVCPNRVEHAAQLASAGIISNGGDQIALRAHCPDVFARHSPRRPRHGGGRVRGRPARVLPGNPLDFAPEVDVEHGVADDGHAL